MVDVKQDLTDAEKAAKAAMLAKVNEDEAWFKANRAWLIACAALFVLGFLAAHLVKL